MKANVWSTLLIVCGLLLALTGSVGAQDQDTGIQATLGSAFTYQGRLLKDGTPVNDTCDFQFSLWDAVNDGNQVGNTQTINDVMVNNGYLTVSLNSGGEFGGSAFAGEARHLQIATQCTGDGDFVSLGGRVALNAAPYALYALQAPWSGLTGLPAGLDDGDDDTTYTAGTGLSLAGNTFAADTSYLQRRVDSSCGAGNSIRAIAADGTVTCEPDDDSGGDITAVTAGSGLTGGGSSEAVTLDVDWGGSGSATTVSRSDHNHWGETWSGSGTGLRLESYSGVALYARTNSGNGNIIEAWSSNTDRVFYVERGGDVRAAGPFIDGGADYAELLSAVAGLEPADVLVIGPDGQLARSTQPYQANVAGVYSTQPGFIAGGGDESADVTDDIPLAMMGVVPVKASAENGPIHPGDLLTTSSTPGHAMKASPLTVGGVTFYPSGVIVGKALEGLDEGSGVIEMLVVLQ
jgi:hypothetical protein